jgi:hypothetical protein
MARARTADRTAAALVLAGAACTFQGPAASPDPGQPDAAPDGGETDPPTTGAIDFLPVAEERFAAGSWTIDRDASINTTDRMTSPALPASVTLEHGVQESGDPVAILRLQDLKVNRGRTLRVTGVHPLVILASRDVTIDGTLDAGARASAPGPGGWGPAAGTGAGGIAAHAGMFDDSGGGGGGFGTAGARGGSAGAAVGGAPGAAHAVDKLLGGSGGGAAGVCANLAGAGGGAVLLYGHRRVRITGQVTAGGGGGAGGVTGCVTSTSGGAGGGAGGLIWIQAGDLEGDGILAANGGGGGGGGYVSASGGPGKDAPASIDAAAQGGTAPSGGSAGGAGAIATAPAATVPALSDGNGGGGGGGLGWIVIRAPSFDAIRSSPTAVAPPAGAGGAARP